MHVRLVKSFGFEAAHWLPTFPQGHKCRRLHGHSFRVEIAVEGKAFDPLHGELDHRCLNDIKGLENPTSEVLAAWLWKRLAPALPQLAEVVVQETCTARCEYRGPGR
jgi:6-pyruvoyltetrahydropterin/6-carboxytetrahydropterin synthase